jgi:probable rRNA maturation factor
MPPKIEKMDLEKYAVSALKKWVKTVEAHRVLKTRVFNTEAIREKRSFQVDLTVCTAPKMTKLNHQYRGKKEPTDVLSFAADHFFQGQGVLGDLVICAPVVLKQAKEYNHSWKKEIDLLLVHGLLHLLHFDHELGKKEALEMAKWEKKILGSKTLITRATER